MLVRVAVGLGEIVISSVSYVGKLCWLVMKPVLALNKSFVRRFPRTIR